MTDLWTKVKEVLASILPVATLVTLLHLTLAPLPPSAFQRFGLGLVWMIVGLSLFLYGVDLGVGPMGYYLGRLIAKAPKLSIFILASMSLGFVISIAEPDLHILAKQIGQVTGGGLAPILIVLSVSLGIGLLMTLGLLRIRYQFSLTLLFFLAYLLIAVLGFFVSNDFLAIAFDASGATTGALTVPFLLSLATGMASLSKSDHQEDDVFGLVGVASIGAILAVLIMGLVKGTRLADVAEQNLLEEGTSIWYPFLRDSLMTSREILQALLPLLAIYLFCHFVFQAESKEVLKKVLRGNLCLFLGLVLFLVGVHAGFMDVGRQIGYDLFVAGHQGLLVLLSGLLGVLVILAEPAVYVLTHEIETVTQGAIKGKKVLVALSLGTGIAIVLSSLRVLIPQLQLAHLLLPGYSLALFLAARAPKIFVGMAFDAGGVASGPMTATFILAYIQGIAFAKPEANVILDGFGMIALVALMPILTVLLLGVTFGGSVEDKGAS